MLVSCCDEDPKCSGIQYAERQRHTERHAERSETCKKSMIYKKSSNQAKSFTGSFSHFVTASVAVNVLVTEIVLEWKEAFKTLPRL